MAAMDLLARREHSARELHTKLARKFAEPALIESAISQLQEDGLQSDSRYAEAYLRSRAEKGYGPLRIRQEMAQRGLAEADVQLAFEASDLNWLDRVQQVLERKFGSEPAPDFKEKARRARFLQYRGFSSDQIRDVLD